MTDNDFKARLARISDSRPQISESPAVDTVTSGKNGHSPFRPAMWGAASSVIVLLLFYNLQAISDMAPEWIRNSETPGAFGLPIAILSILWFVVIPIWFVIGILIGAIRGKGISPPPFVLGAFVILFVGFALMQIGTPAAP